MSADLSRLDRIPRRVFLGYCAREYWPTPDDWRVPGWSEHVGEVCSTSYCISDRPPGWIERWDFNRASCWNTETAAWACVPGELRGQYRLYAYYAIPLEFDEDGKAYRIRRADLFLSGLAPLPIAPRLRGYEHIGYDVVQYQHVLNWGCSPLSCNGMGDLFTVNRYYLLDYLSDAVVAASRFGRERCEPGPFIIVEVHRRASFPY